MKKVVVISSSLRPNSNSETMAKSFADGAREAGHEVVFISLKDKQIGFCKGCFACLSTGQCSIKDDAIAIEQEVLTADAVVFATPIYYYEMSGQMKTLLDRLNPMYPKEYRFRDVYMLSTAAEDEADTPSRAESGLQGFMECFGKARLAGTIFCGGVNDGGDIEGHQKLRECCEAGKNI